MDMIKKWLNHSYESLLTTKELIEDIELDPLTRENLLVSISIALDEMKRAELIVERSDKHEGFEIYLNN